MKKFLGVGFVFEAIDKGLEKLISSLNKKSKDLQEDVDKLNASKPAKGSFFDAISEISKLGLLKGISDQLTSLGGKIEDESPFI